MLKNRKIIMLTLAVFLGCLIVRVSILSHRSVQDVFLKKINKKTEMNIRFSSQDIVLYHETEYNLFGEGNRAIIAKLCNYDTKRQLVSLIDQFNWKNLKEWDDAYRDEILGSIEDSVTVENIPIDVMDSSNANYLLPNSNQGYAYLHVLDENDRELHRYIILMYLDNIDVLYICSYN